MKARTTIPFFILFVFSFLFSCQTNNEKEIGKHPSGAAYSLDHFTYLRTYPDGKLHRKKYELAFQQKQLQTVLTEQENEGDFEALGPKNIGGRTLCIAFHPTDAATLFVGSASGGLWKSTTSGQGVNAWEKIKTGFPVLGVGAIAIQPDNPDIMYIGTGEVYNFSDASIGNVNRITRGTYGVGILKTEDGGNSWSKSLDWELDDFTGVQDLMMNPQNASTIFAATTEGLYRSQDSGSNWALVNNVEMAVDIEISPQDSNMVFVTHGGIDSPSAGIYRSIDGGSTFTKLDGGLPNSWDGKALLGIAPSSPNKIYASIANSFEDIGLFQSLDNGTNWELLSNNEVAIHQGWYSHDIAVNPNDANSLIHVGFEAWRSINAGASFDQVSEWDAWTFGQVPVGGPEGPSYYVHADIHQVKYHPFVADLVYLMTDGGIFASEDNGLNWEGRNGGYQTQQFYANFSNSRTDPFFAIGGMQDNATAIYTGQDAWTRVLFADGMCTAINQNNDNLVYGSYQRLGLLRSVDRGQSWFDSAPFFDVSRPIFNAPVALAPTDQLRMYAGSQRMHISENGGDSWTSSNANVSGSNSVLTIAVSPTNKFLLYASTADVVLTNPPTVAKSTDGGFNWTEITGLPNRNAADIAFDPLDDQVAYAVFSGYNTNHVYTTSDGGQNWIPIDNGLPDVPTNTIVIDPLNPDNLYVGNDLGVYVSTDAGANWEVYSEGLPEATLVMHLSISPSNRKLRVATHGTGVYQGDLKEDTPPVSTNDLSTKPVKDFKNYPNPVSADSRVRFVLEQKSNVELSLFSNNGKLVQTLFSGDKLSGKHEFNFNWQDLPIGVYYYTIQTKTAQTNKSNITSTTFIKQ